MIVLDVQHNIDRVVAELSDTMARQVPFATSVAINRTAQEVPAEMGREAGRVFDRPRPFTAGPGAMYVRRSTKTNLSAVVGYKDIQARYLRWQVEGGARVQKGFERLLSGMGLLPAGYRTAPGQGIRVDGYGNIPRATLNQILAQLKSGASVYSGRGKRMSLEGLFVILPGATAPQARHLSPGIWRRIERGSERAVSPIIHYISRAAYARLLDVEGVAQKVVSDRFDANFSAALQQALATAR